MDFKGLTLKTSYESGQGDILEDFYIPVLSCSATYDRIAGFFSSSMLAVAARGMGEFIRNGGRMRLLCSPKLNKEDISIICNTASLESASVDLKLDEIEDEFMKNHVKALGWLLQNGRLEIRLAVPKNPEEETLKQNALFHQKVGILTDHEGNSLSFSGSINETATAWVDNIEEFKVFKQWEAPTFYEDDRQRFDSMWNNQRSNLQLFDLPSAVKENLMEYSKDFDCESISLQKYIKRKSKVFKFKDSRIPLFWYQAEALDKWKNHDCQMLFEMATGTGKTRTAIAGLDWLLKTEKRLIIIVSCPQSTLAEQWREKEVEPLGVKVDTSIMADSSHPKWEQEMRTMLLKHRNNKISSAIIYTTHDTSSGDRFRKLIQNEGKGCTFLFIGDEAHWLGADQLRKALVPDYKYRIGLSATPSRWFDDDGTRLLQSYFGGESFEFTIADALTQFNPLTDKHFLVKYRYDIRKVNLTESESSKYVKLCKELVKLSVIPDKDDALLSRYQSKLRDRAQIIKNAFEKYRILEQILDELLLDGRLCNTIIFVSPQQIDTVCSILFEKGIAFHRLTEKESTRPEIKYRGLSQRQHIIEQFKKGELKVLVAIKCLDEGIDIPVADRGILMASGANPREFIQRIGRIIRQAPDKEIAYLYDICPSTLDCLDSDEKELEKKLLEKEFVRIKEIASNAHNYSEALKMFYTIQS